MCELFGMSARFSTSVRVSLDELARHGGGTGPHRDGWGVAFLQEGDAFVVREPSAANDSACLGFLQGQEFKTNAVLAHIRKATQGGLHLKNTQPFTRELGGVIHVFAHNGTLHGIEKLPGLTPLRFRRIGDTDSEYAFCSLLERLAPLWANGCPTMKQRVDVIAQFATEIRSIGPANFLYADSDCIFAHGHKRTNSQGVVTPPGLHLLCRACHPESPEVGLAGVEMAHDVEQHAAIVASVPLSAEPWEPLAEGEILVLREGRLVHRVLPACLYQCPSTKSSAPGRRRFQLCSSCAPSGSAKNRSSRCARYPLFSSKSASIPE